MPPPDVSRSRPPKRTRLFYLLLLSLAFFATPGASPASAAPDTPASASTAKRPKIGLVLSGGGARGIAHIGVLRFLEERGIVVDCIAGTSMGAIVGALYAAGYSPAEMEKLVLTIPWDKAFTDRPAYEEMSFRRKEDSLSHRIDLNIGIGEGKVKMAKGLVAGQNLGLIMKELFIHVAEGGDFDRLPIPFRAVAADIETGKAVSLHQGDLARAVMASMAIPGVFAPVEIDGKILVDGGIADNLPLDVARAMGAEVLIVVDIATPLRKKEGLQSAASITAQIMTILIQQNVAARLSTLKEEDILLRPDLKDLGTTDFSRVREALSIGYKAAASQGERLKTLAVPPDEFHAFLAKHRRAPFQPPVIDYVRVEGKTSLSPRVLASQVETKEGQKLDMKTLKDDINRIYGLDIFERVDFNLEKKDDRRGLAIKAVEKSWGPTFMRFNLSLADNFSGSSDYTIGLQLTRTAVNSLGAEWRNSFQIGETPRLATEFYQPLDSGNRYFIAPLVEYMERNINLYKRDEPGTILARYRDRDLTGGIDMGRRFGNWGELRVGLRRSYGAYRVNVGGPEYESGSGNRGGLYSFFAVDTMDNADYPKRGTWSRGAVKANLPEVGSDFKATGLEVGVDQAVTWRRLTVIPGFVYMGMVDGDSLIEDAYTTGGFLNLSGYLPGELAGREIGLGRLVTLTDLGTFGLGNFRSTLYLGASLEAGNAWPKDAPMDWDSLIWAGSLFLGAKTFIGPAYLYYGLAEGRRQTVGLFIGQRY
ncbi:MAG TPA: patatin-like phospholipase family protein [Syntrophales bacterium]|nr:patatin-like phospholipase family protein [Syntrophales bacterium]